jgi:hypothetical protein
MPAWRDCLWGYQHANDSQAKPPSAAAALWRAMAKSDCSALECFLVEQGWIKADPEDFY